MKLLHQISNLLFPPKCLLCGKVLKDSETDLCHSCRCDTPEHPKADIKLSHIADWTALWYYEGNVRYSLLRFKFYNRRGYARIYGRLLGMKLLKERIEFDILTWVPISALRRLRRGYDQVELIAYALAEELGVTPVPTLKKHRNTPPQSGLKTAPQRRANVLGAYKALQPQNFSGKRVLLLDDILTTGATASECARVLLTAGAKQVICATVAAAPHNQKISR